MNSPKNALFLAVCLLAAGFVLAVFGPLSVLRHRRRALTNNEVFHCTDHQWKVENLGSEYGGYSIVATDLNPDSVVYSVGVGEDTTFEEELIAAYGLKRVFLFDPTPEAVAHVNKRKRDNPDLENRLVFRPEALAVKGQTASFVKAAKSTGVSMTMLASKVQKSKGSAMKMVVGQLEDWMRDLGHSNIDILKLDIEGNEFDVLDHLLGSKEPPPFDQLVLEWHVKFDPTNLRSRKTSIERGLERAGYCEFTAKGNGHSVGFKRAKK